MGALEYLRQRYPNAENNAGQAESMADMLMHLTPFQAKEVYVSNQDGILEYWGYVPLNQAQSAAAQAELDGQLLEAIRLYEKLLTMPDYRSSDRLPVNDERLRIRAKLTRVKAQRSSREQTLTMYQDLLTKSMAFDQNLTGHFGVVADYSVFVWREMQPFLNPIQDADYIATMRKKMINAGIRGQVIPPYGINLVP